MSEQTDYQRIAVILRGKVTDIDLLTRRRSVRIPAAPAPGKER